MLTNMQARNAPSMGPLIFTSGNCQGAVSVVFLLRFSFNGAADFHQRKLRIMQVAQAVQADPSMGPLIFTSGNSRRLSAGPRGPGASMGPLIFTSGNNVNTTVSSSSVNCFNGAADFHQRKFEAALGAVFLLPTLQWGR